jgi:hypothetical protein
MAITLTSTDNPSDTYRKANAFPMPGSSDTIKYYEDEPDPVYQAYLVRVTAFDNECVSFKGVNLSTGSASETTRTVYYKDMRTMFLPAPSSTLGTWDNTTNTCIILLLSDDYVDGKSDLEAALGIGGKWPKGSGLPGSR